jgi:hypothetical protein
MAVVTAATTTITPDRYDDYLDVVRKAKGLVLKSGRKNARGLAASVAPNATGTFGSVSDADDYAAVGAVLERALADPEVIALMTTAPASPLRQFQVSMWTDVPV